MIYSVTCIQLDIAYDMSGSELPNAYDIDGNVVYNPTPVPVIDPMDWSNLSDDYKANMNAAVSYADSYKTAHASAYAFPVLTDVHDKLYNEPNFILYNHPTSFDKFMFFGDIANAYTKAQLDNALAYMQEANLTDTFALVGNHELGEYEIGNDLPKVWYQTLVPESAVLMAGDALVYYIDDEENGVRFICLDSCTPIYKSSGTQLFTKNELEFMASAIDASNGKDIIILNHSMAQSYYLVTDTEKETPISTTGITNRGIMDAIINAYINRESYSFVDDSGVSHTHDYSDATGSFIGYFTGHTHHAGYNNANGYNAFTCPSSYYNSDAGMSVFIIDPTAKKVIWIIAYKNKSTYDVYEYAF